MSTQKSTQNVEYFFEYFFENFFEDFFETFTMIKPTSTGDTPYTAMTIRAHVVLKRKHLETPVGFNGGV